MSAKESWVSYKGRLPSTEPYSGRTAKGQQDHLYVQPSEDPPSADQGHCRVRETSHLGDLRPLSSIQEAHLLSTTHHVKLSLNTCHGPWTPESPGTLHSTTTQVRTRGPGCNEAGLLQSHTYARQWYPGAGHKRKAGGYPGPQAVGPCGYHGLGTPLASPCPLAARGKRGKLTPSPRQQLQRRNDTAVLVPQPPA